MEKPERVLGNVATRLLSENARVRIWEMDLAPGARSDTHRHDADYVLVQIEGDRIAAMPEPDTQGAYTEYIEAEVVPGKVRYITRGGVETAINIGRRRYREILIELK
jgi:hypothetical protein